MTWQGWLIVALVWLACGAVMYGIGLLMKERDKHRRGDK